MKTTILLTGFGILTAAFLSLSNLNLFEPGHAADAGKQQSTVSESYAFGHDYQLPLEAIAYTGANEVSRITNNPDKGTARLLLHNPAELEHIFLDAIEYIEEAETIDLGFDVDAYLPADFDPYAGMMVNPDKVPFIEDEEPVELGFETAKYLPVGFNSYSNNVLNIEDINYMEEEEGIELGFDVNAYLPAGFDPYARIAQNTDPLNLDDISYIEDEEPIEINTGLPGSLTIFFYPN